MTTQLSSLRVTAELDASKYIAAARAKSDADAQMAASGRAVGASIQETNVRLADSGGAAGRLSRTYIDGYRNAEQFERALRGLNRQVELGNVDQQRAADILAGIAAKHRLNVDAALLSARGYTNLAAASGAATGAAAAGSAAFKLSAFELQNLGYQINDVVSGLAMGQRPLTVAMQQGGQIAQIFAGRIGAARAALLAFAATPTGQFALGLTAAVAALGGMIAIIQSRIPNADIVLKQHEDAIKAIKAAWDGAETSAERYGPRAQSQIQFSVTGDRQRLADLLKSQEQSLYSTLGLGPRAPDAAYQLTYGPFTEAVKSFRQEARNGTADIAAFREEVRRLAAAADPANQSIRRQAEALLAATSAANATTDALRSLNAQAAETDVRFRTSAGQLAATLGNDAATRLRQLQGERTASLAGIGARSPTALGSAARQQVLAQPLDLKNDPYGTLRSYQAETAALVAEQQALKGLRDAEDQRARSLASSLAAARQDVALVGQGIAATTRLRTELQLTQQAKDAAAQAGTLVSPAEIARIKAAADEMGRLAEAQARANLLADLKFQREQLGRSPVEQQVASQLRSIYGGDYAKYFGSNEAILIRTNERLQAINDVGQQLTRGFLADLRSGLKQGENFWQSFGDAGKSALDKIADKLIEMAADDLWSLAFGGATKSSGGLISTLLGFAGAGRGSAGAGGGGWFMAGGGPISGPGTGTSDSILARLSNGEYVVNAVAAAQHRRELDRINFGALRGYAAGGPVGATPAGGSLVFSPNTVINLAPGTAPDVVKAVNDVLDARERAWETALPGLINRIMRGYR